MGDHHPLRGAGRSGRVQDVRQVGLDRPFLREWLSWLPGHRGPRHNGRALGRGNGRLLALRAAGHARHHHYAARPGDGAGQGGRLGRPRLVRHDHGGAAVPHDLAEPLGGCLRVERHIAGPGLQRPVYPDDRGGRLGGEDRHPVAGRHAQPHQRPGHLVTQPVQLLVGEQAAPGRYRRPLRLPRRGLGQQPLQ